MVWLSVMMGGRCVEGSGGVVGEEGWRRGWVSMRLDITVTVKGGVSGRVTIVVSLVEEDCRKLDDADMGC